MALQHNLCPGWAGGKRSKRAYELLSPREDPVDDHIDDQLDNEPNIGDSVWPGYDLFALGNDASPDNQRSFRPVSDIEMRRPQTQHFGMRSFTPFTQACSPNSFKTKGDESALEYTDWGNPDSIFDGLALDGLALDGLALDGLALDGLALDGLALDGLALDGLAFDIPQPGALSEILPLLNPSLPPGAPSIIPAGQPNPFLDKSLERYQFKGRLSFKIPESGEVNGYIKFRLCRTEDHADTRGQKTTFYPATRGKRGRYAPEVPREHPPYVLPNFGRTTKLAAYDARLLSFYKNVFCAGRTLLTTSNFWVTQLLGIADGNECVNRILLAFTAAYILDYQPTNEMLRRRANSHYKRAANLLGVALQQHATRQVGKEEAAVAALLFLVCDDIVHWETQRRGDCNPKWLQGIRMATSILDNTDPGYRYWKASNVQSGAARIALANRVAFVEILTLPVSPLAVNRQARLYGWLVEGDKRETYKIFGDIATLRAGGRGKLEATRALNEALGLTVQDPNSQVYLEAAKVIHERLGRLRQWSEISDGYQSAEELFDSCTLDSSSHVQTVAKVTELTAEAWRTAAQIYLVCRFFR
ncbi:hypothetical protein A9K55_003836 [Cordyceps militaris]|uniref:Uncharacterized protein n=1 Tax=Cordyceps militaris TaxID=73501 RepID=A0A2H4SMB7_CORMI|nr:hypothetical protein A9K55_003836 [Cordyceps militaris]